MRRFVYHWKKTETYRSSLIPFSSIGKKGVISTTMMTIFLERLFLSSCRKISFFSNNRGETLRLIPYSYFTRLVLGSKEEFIVVFQYCVAICQQIWKTQQWPHRQRQKTDVETAAIETTWKQGQSFCDQPGVNKGVGTLGMAPDLLAGSIIERNAQCAKLRQKQFFIHVLSQKRSDCYQINIHNIQNKISTISWIVFTTLANP